MINVFIFSHDVSGNTCVEVRGQLCGMGSPSSFTWVLEITQVTRLAAATFTFWATLLVLFFGFLQERVSLCGAG